MSSTSMLSSPNFLRNVLRVDALSCIACGVLQMALHTLGLAHANALPHVLVLAAYTVGFFLLAVRRLRRLG